MVGSYVAMFYYQNGTLALAMPGHGSEPIPLPPGHYVVTISSGLVSETFSIDAMLGGNVTITLTTLSTLNQYLAQYGPLIREELLALGYNSGPASLLTVLRVGLGSVLALVIGLAVLSMLGVIGLMIHAYNSNRDYLEFLRINRAPTVYYLFILDIPIYTASSLGSLLGIVIAQFTWRYVFNLFNISLLGTPLWLLDINPIIQLLTLWLSLSVVLIPMQWYGRGSVLGHGQ